jgi:hypothetical protein
VLPYGRARARTWPLSWALLWSSLQLLHLLRGGMLPGPRGVGGGDGAWSLGGEHRASPVLTMRLWLRVMRLRLRGLRRLPWCLVAWRLRSGQLLWLLVLFPPTHPHLTTVPR